MLARLILLGIVLGYERAVSLMPEPCVVISYCAC
ncbi:hypothetical protein ATK36_2616 [Amycolatopsis sulphurea]|uniref:Uncharacterized protein n=1 Tax=Amycolatopsis sulphurea TaxID=76022 RepID=A0A2A9FAP4_9PSEU|nr:hypothetical protein ATK36_2616 [Amycolatopsis sulphurea]